MNINTICQIQSVSELESFINSDTLVLFDLDHTVFESAEIYGHGNWFYDQVCKGEQAGIPIDHTITRIFPEWIESQQCNAVQPVEPITPKLIESLQERGTCVMALTARPEILIPSTMRQLRSLQVDFSKTAVSPGQHSDLAYATYHEGILFTDDGHSKAKALNAYFEAGGKKAKRVVVIDDSKSVLTDLHALLVDLSVEFVGLHYTLVDSRRDSWDPEEAARIFELRRTQNQPPRI